MKTLVPAVLCFVCAYTSARQAHANPTEAARYVYLDRATARAYSNYLFDTRMDLIRLSTELRMQDEDDSAFEVNQLVALLMECQSHVDHITNQSQPYNQRQQRVWTQSVYALDRKMDQVLDRVVARLADSTAHNRPGGAEEERPSRPYRSHI